MIPTLIALAIIFLAITGILSVSATFTVTYDNKWTTIVKILWYEKEIKLSSILNFILFPDKAAHEARSKQQEKKPSEQNADAKPVSESDEAKPEQKANQPSKKQSKPNYIKKLFDEDGIVGIFLLISNMFQSASTAINTLFRGFHIYSLYVKMIIGGGDAADVAEKYGQICSYYYPVKGLILNGMKVDEYNEVFFADFIAPRSEYALEFIGSISVRLLLKIVISAAKTFLINMMQNNKNSK